MPPSKDQIQNTTPFSEPLWHARPNGIYYGQSHKKLREEVRAYIEEKISPNCAEWETQGHVPKEILLEHSRRGYTAVTVNPAAIALYIGNIQLPGGIRPEEWDSFHDLVCIDEIARCGYLGVIWALGCGDAIGLPPVINFGTEAQKLEFLPRVIQGQDRFCLAVTEPDAGSDVANIGTVAERRGDVYIVNGAKKWITNGMWATHCTAAVRTGGPGKRGISALVISLQSKGVSRRKISNSGVEASAAKQLNPTRECVVFLSDGYRATYGQLYQTTLEIAKGLLAHGIRRGDRVGIFAANIPAYVELLFAVSHVGGSLVVFNMTYIPQELKYALKHSGCKAIFVAPSLGKIPTTKILDMLGSYEMRAELMELETVILLKELTSNKFETYHQLRRSGESVPQESLEKAMSLTTAEDVCNFQYTSGTTGRPKAAMLSHRSIVNNGKFVGDRMRLTSRDILCCPPPLFHCFGLVLGLLAVFTHGACIVFPSETFQPSAVLEAVSAEKCTALHGVPAMFSAEIELIKPISMNFSSLRTGIAAGAPIPKKLMADLRGKLNMAETTITYGMTETAPASFMSFTDDPVEKRLATVGKILPHTKAKIVNGNGEIVPIGTRGELWVSGFQLQKGYWKSPVQTADAMILDSEGCLWMKTGDEAIFDDDGYCSITGRIKDIIIRGGENIAPLEIEERLGQHESIVQSSVVGLPDQKYGEVVCAFLRQRLTEQRPSVQELRDFVRQALGWHKAPVHIFWLQEGEDFPTTGSGKIQKHLLRAQGVERLKREIRTSKL